MLGWINHNYFQKKKGINLLHFLCFQSIKWLCILFHTIFIVLKSDILSNQKKPKNDLKKKMLKLITILKILEKWLRDVFSHFYNIFTKIYINLV